MKRGYTNSENAVLLCSFLFSWFFFPVSLHSFEINSLFVCPQSNILALHIDVFLLIFSECTHWSEASFVTGTGLHLCNFFSKEVALFSVVIAKLLLGGWIFFHFKFEKNQTGLVGANLVGSSLFNKKKKKLRTMLVTSLHSTEGQMRAVRCSILSSSSSNWNSGTKNRW